ncbi:hypothetical protein [Frankia sp. AgB32]|uniref:hypothetical protein n=1 Tax=Frankia sp. AgB32 TaxID=631119 RepID=UPI00200FEF21|nr:hypothetical protein [Frankia sp. AgB32]MCK9895653.1 hypothetical protein [Frankia sp. AgB32]
MGTDGGAGSRSRSGRLQAAFDASFLTAVALPADLTLIRAPDTPGSPQDAAAVRHGHAIWLGQPDAPLYRLDDERWLLASVRRADALARDLLGPAPATRAAAGTAACVERGDPTAGVLQVSWLGPVVARLRITPGEDAALPDDLPAGLARLTRSEVARLAEVAARPRRPRWPAGRWRR